jgi:signal transduction histidine kinase
MHLRSIRARVLVLVTIPLVSLIGLYAFATTLTAKNAITLARAVSIRNQLEDPIGLFEAQVQRERLLATVYIAAPVPQNLAALTAQEAETNRFLSVLQAAASSARRGNDSSPQLKAALAVLLKDTATLRALREQISVGTIGTSAAQGAYSAIVAAGYQAIIQAVLEMPNAHLETQALAVMRITQGAEILLQEQALLVGDVMTRSFSRSAHQSFASLVGEHRGLVAQAMPSLDPVYRSYYQREVSPLAAATLTRLEDAVINTPGGVVPRVPLQAYEQASGAVAGGLDIAGYRAGPTLAAYGRQVADPVYWQLVLAGGLGLFAIIASIIASLWIGRGLVRELGGLRKAALDLADVRLPHVVARLSLGQDVAEADGEVPFPNPTRDEIGQVRQAFNSVQRTAIDAAVGQARLRAGIATVFRNLSRRSQSLLHRQLAMLDDLELRAGKPEELEALFQIDHLTTRMRRHAEGLVVLAGDRPGRGWNRPVPLADVLRAAVAEVEDYRRVKVITQTRAALAGRAVADVIHLIAELVENATIFSPPSTPVRVMGGLVGQGFAVEIEDRGLGITESAMAGLNAKLAAPPQMDLAASDQLGLYVAARLAKQHGIRVTLRDSPFGGTTAIVLIPNDLVVSEESYSADPDAGLANELDIQATGRHAVRRDQWVPPSSDHAEASLAEPGQEGLQHFAAPAVTVPEQAGPAEPLFPETGGWITAETMRPFFPFTADEGAGLQNGEEEPQATAEFPTELDLPRRVRQASLAPQLRDNTQPQDAAGTDGGSSGERSPNAARDAFTALQRGWERGRAGSEDGWPGATASPCDASPGPGPDDNGSTSRPGTSEQDGTP